MTDIKKGSLSLIPILSLLLSCSTATAQDQPTQFSNTKLVGGPCEGCEAVFEFGDRPLAPVDTLPAFSEADQKLKVTGTIYRPDGKTPAADVIIYIYHTNAEGAYPTRGDETGWGRRHGYLRGWVRTEADGRYTFYTQKPGSYSRNPAHIHPIILEPDGTYYYIAEYLFEGDPNLNNGGSNRGGSGLIKLRPEENMLVAERDIILGLNVPGYDN